MYYDITDWDEDMYHKPPFINETYVINVKQPELVEMLEKLNAVELLEKN